MFGHRSGDIIAIADIRSGSAAVAIIATGDVLRVIAFAREHLPLEKRTESATINGLVQALGTAGESALKEFTASAWKKSRITNCICIVGAPWTQSQIGAADSHLEHPTTITENVIAEHAKTAVANQKNIDPKDLFEATVVRVLLNGYATAKPVGKKANFIHVFALMSTCNPIIKTKAEETLHRLFPGTAQIAWRSSARATLAALQEANAPPTCLVVDVDAEASDLLVIHKGSLLGRDLVPQGVRSIAEVFMPGKPVEETLTLLDLLEKDRCENDACEQIKEAIATAEPNIAHTFGETLAKLSARRRVSEQLVLIAPSRIASWFTQFFMRIDFTQFTVTTEPFTPQTLTLDSFSSLPKDDPRLSEDTGLMIACALVNTEMRA